MSEEKKSICPKCIELAKELDRLSALVQTLTTENTKLTVLLTDNGLDANPNKISDTEAICLEQLRMLKNISTQKKFSAEDAKVLDLLHSNLIRARGGKVDDSIGRKAKKLNDGDLLKLVQEIE